MAPLNEGAQQLLEKNRSSMVRCPVDMFYKSLTNYVKDKTFAYLESERNIEQVRKGKEDNRGQGGRIYG